MLPLRILLLVATAFGAAIPPNPSCLEKCLVAGGIVGAAADLNFFKSVAVDINNFCNVYTALLKCASGCSQDDLNLVMKHTMHASYICKEKLQEVRSVHDCLESDASDPLSDCSKVCEVTEHVPLRLDSTATAPVNPNVPAEGTGPLCAKQMCVLKCAREQLNKQCAGAGDLFKEVARHQVEIGWDMLQSQSENTNDTASQLVALTYLANIPEKCVFLTNLEAFDKEVGGDMMKKPEMIPGSDFSNDTAVETAESSASEDSTGFAPVLGGFDPTLFEFTPELEPDVPLGPPQEQQPEPETREPVPNPPEEEVKVIGATQTTTTEATTTMEFEDSVVEQSTSPVAPPRQSGSTMASSIDASSEHMAGVHEQPKPAEVAVSSEGGKTAIAVADETGAHAEVVDDKDKEVAMSPRPVDGAAEEGGSGLVAARPVSEQDKEDAEEEEESPGEMSKTVEAKVDGGDKKGEETAVAEAAPVEEDEEEEEKAAIGDEKEKTAEDTAEEAEMSDEMAGEVEKEIEAGKDSEGSSMSTDATIVVDDEQESEIDHNEVKPVTEEPKMNSAPATLSVFTALVALAAVVLY